MVIIGPLSFYDLYDINISSAEVVYIILTKIFQSGKNNIHIDNYQYDHIVQRVCL